MDIHYPAKGFHFLVRFALDINPIDVSFQSVSGLSVETEFEEIKEGGQRRFTHQLPVRTKYADLVLKRGLYLSSNLTKWFRKAFDDFQYEPIDLEVILLNDLHAPLKVWSFQHALPKKLEISSFNAESSEIVIETLTLSYQSFKELTQIP